MINDVKLRFTRDLLINMKVGDSIQPTSPCLGPFPLLGL